jgi:hypothetical protein
VNRAVAIALKIPDNTAYTAGVALRRLGVGVERVERSEIRFFDDGGNAAALVKRVEADATIFNPNKHRAIVLSESRPRPGEVWIESLDGAPRKVTAWRLFDVRGEPLSSGDLHAAAERLLCNPAIERAVTGRDIPSTSE